MTTEIKNRRPIRSRETRWANKTAMWLSHKGIAPNDISLFSVICAEIAAIALLLAFNYTNYWLSMLFCLVAVVGMQSRLICNLLDGMVAIEGGAKSAVGPIYNELPDRLSDTIIFLGVGYGLWMFESAAYLAWAAALFSVMTAYIRLLGGTCGLEQKFLGPMAKQHRMTVLTAGCAASIFVPFYGHWILYICLWVITIGAFLTVIWRTYQIVLALNYQCQDDILPIEKEQNDNDKDTLSEDFPRIFIDKL
ncbi:phosphatidylglycerophosphate synthase [Orbus hercynius]|uniref:Phosphatidylglycerophosphate synthase n=1 Tax=Orbus hercynius TaxID=593135 RepID=A0A495RC72_9GAMM|nr:CDP-alcohol phosphatidyltransferase family protein [Orbus hercynius]RKS84618.1 phosphatidylglycerophosphate synthase [Orbus hercynius]